MAVSPRARRALAAAALVLLAGGLAGPASAAPAAGTGVVAQQASARAAAALPAYRTSVRTVTREELGASWRPGCAVAPKDLRQITVRYVGGNGRAYDGVIVMNKQYVGVTQRVF
ncbi:hypothetical protein WDZ17_00185 [Pseudokineococcus basanitobsidens]|uniref:Uncharacterized protein n=1 Tax=Pseudokineococcus basanitobsidens TaxID=1926649 RepID=A0ABU8RF56_9ACTN